MGLTDARDMVIDWIAGNYFVEMQGLLEGDGYRCDSQTEPPWYTTDAPRSVAMELHNEALTRLIEKGKGNSGFGPLAKKLLLGTLELKRFSERDIERQRKAEGKL